MKDPKQNKIAQLIRQRQGPLTRNLVQTPADFGLGNIPARLLPDETTDTICGFCSTGCALKVHLRNGEAINLSPTTRYPVNLGMACPKGWEALTPLGAPDRATKPLVRNGEGELKPTTWNVAMKTFTDRLRVVQERNGPASAAFLSTGQIVSEEMAFLGALAKFGMGMVHGDGNTRQCMATAVTAYKQSFGFDAPPYTYADFEESDVIILVGSNLCIAHPIMWQRILLNRRNPEIVVVDPRRTETAMAATRHFAIRPKSDLILFYGIARLLIHAGQVDSEFIANHTSGYAEFQQFTENFSLDRVSAATGMSGKSIQKLASLIGSGKRVSFWWTMGVNQSHEGTRTAQAIINLALMTGNIGQPGTGANSITGQCNAMGSRLFSNTTNLLGGHDFTNPEHRNKIARILKIPVSLIPVQKSWPYDRIVEGIARDEIKALWIVATNSSHSWIHQDEFNDLVKKLDLLVVQDMYATTETAQRADLVLPAAAWGEKEGTFINSERRFGVVKKVRRAPGEALSDFRIFRLIAHYWGCDELFSKWSSPEAVFKRILREVTREQPCDISGIPDYNAIDASGGIQWPLPEHENSNGKLEVTCERRLFEDGRFYHPDGRAKFIFDPPRELPEPVCKEYPFLLNTGRGTSSQWHTQTRTAKSDVLRKLYPKEIYMEINPSDARRIGIADCEKVRVSSRRATIVVDAALTTTVPEGQVFIPMHYPAANRLTHSSFDPHSRQPAYKSSAVKIEKVGLQSGKPDRHITDHRRLSPGLTKNRPETFQSGHRVTS